VIALSRLVWPVSCADLLALRQKGDPGDVFATCTYQEYRPGLGGLPAQSSNGFPRFKLAYPLHTMTARGKVQHKMPLTYPTRPMMGLPEPEFTGAYIALMDQRGVTAVARERSTLLASLDLDPDTVVVLLCFDRLDKIVKGQPRPWCHRTLFSAWWTARTGHEVPEFGALPPAPEIRAQQPPTLFDH
jgi:hypothetical protein